MKSKKKKIEQIAELLPEGLTETTVEKIATLVQEHVEDKFQKAVKGLEAKVFGFLTVHMDKIKSSALDQLNEENETYRRSNLMNMFMEAASLEFTDRDSKGAMSKLVTENTEAASENNILVNELNEVLTVTDTMEQTLEIMHDKLEKLEEEYDTLEHNFISLQETKKLPFKSSEIAIVQDTDGKVGPGADRSKSLNESIKRADNVFLNNEEMMSLMPN